MEGDTYPSGTTGSVDMTWTTSSWAWKVLASPSAVWKARPGLRLDGFVDAALVHDPVEGAESHGHVGTGAAVEAALPGRILLGVDWGFGWQARDREGRRGTHVVRITAYRIL